MSQALATTKMSSRGQVVIPESIRDELGLEAGARFVVLGQDDVVMFKVISPPSKEEYARLKRQLRKQAREAGLKRSDIPKAIARVRGRR
jgi:AbrB family looped-hinge helix DNA binding protein